MPYVSRQIHTRHVVARTVCATLGCNCHTAFFEWPCFRTEEWTGVLRPEFDATVNISGPIFSGWRKIPIQWCMRRQAAEQNADDVCYKVPAICDAVGQTIVDAALRIRCRNRCRRSRSRSRCRSRFRKNRVRTGGLCRCFWGVCAAAARQAKEPGRRVSSRKRVGVAPGAYERQNGQIRKNRTRSYMNGSTATANLRKRRTLFFT